MKLKFLIFFSIIFFTITPLNILEADQEDNLAKSTTAADKKNITDRPLMVVVIMIKNEEPVIRETLQPFVDAGIQEYLIFDTGSTDKTIEITEKFFKDNNIQNAVIKQEPFVDFATSRNRALVLTEEAFPKAEFMLMLDAEWYMHGIPELLNFCITHKNDPCPSYLVRLIMNETLDFYAPRLIKMTSKSRFYGVVHETLDKTTKEKAPSAAFFEVKTSRFGREKSKNRWYRDKDLLLKEHEKNPTDARTVFYLAQTYDCLEDLENAKIWYKKRINTPGWYEENFVALYRLAQVYENLGNWEKALIYFSKAYSYRPVRIEPLVRIAQHYWNTNEKELCYLYAKRACEVQYPESDILFVEKDLYEFTRYDLLGMSAWYLGEYAVGKNAVLKALEAHPEFPHLQRNLECYNTIAA